MTRTYCDFCNELIPNAGISNNWFLPLWRKSSIIQNKMEVASIEICLCDKCAKQIATLIGKYKDSKLP